jgi:hypothetical protein
LYYIIKYGGFSFAEPTYFFWKNRISNERQRKIIMNETIALVGMACRYPDADTPKALWENVLAKRRAFRQLPPERLNLSDYFSEELTTPDAIYSGGAIMESPLLFDPQTKIGRSDPFTDGSLFDNFGAPVCQVGTATTCSTIGPPQLPVKDGDFWPPWPLPFIEGPVGTNEVHTQILQLHLRDLGKCGTTSKNAVRIEKQAGPPYFPPRSIGEVEALPSSGGAFPAESFFNVFVEVDLDWPPLGNVDMTAFNMSPLYIANNQLQKFPPKVVYIHGGSSAYSNPLLYYVDAAGYPTPMGHIVLAGHGVGYACGGVVNPTAAATLPDNRTEFLEIMDEHRASHPIDTLALEPVGCNPGPNWVNKCTRGIDVFHSEAIVKIDWLDAPGDPVGEPDFEVRLKDPKTTVYRGRVVDDVLPTEMVILNLTGQSSLGNITVRAGDGTWNGGCDNELCSFGTVIQSGELTADSKFEIAFEIDIDTPSDSFTLHACNNEKHVVSAQGIVSLPPKGATYIPPSQKPIPLCKPDSDIPVAYLVDARHVVLSITLDSFTATASNGEVALEWATGTEKDNAGFKVWRGQPLDGQCSNDPKNYKDVQAITPLVNSKGTEVSGATYTMTDSNVVSGNTYCYALEDRDFAGKSTYHLDNIVSATP